MFPEHAAFILLIKLLHFSINHLSGKKAEGQGKRGEGAYTTKICSNCLIIVGIIFVSYAVISTDSLASAQPVYTHSHTHNAFLSVCVGVSLSVVSACIFHHLGAVI